MAPKTQAEVAVDLTTKYTGYGYDAGKSPLDDAADRG
jgi:hypothetical protein